MFSVVLNVADILSFAKQFDKLYDCIGENKRFWGEVKTFKNI